MTELKSKVTQVLKYTDHTLPGSPDGQVTFTEAASMLSGNHLPLDTDRDTGGPFQLVKTADYCTVLHKDHVNAGCNWHGDFTASHSTAKLVPSNQNFSSVSNLALISMGTTAIARCAPVSPVFSLPNTLGETLSDGLPSIVGRESLRNRAHAARAAGKEYLNHQFGWVPLVSDLRGLAYAVVHSDEILRAYIKGSNKKQRRGYVFPEKSYSGTTDYGTTASVPARPAPGLRGQTMVTSSQRIWFSGAFKYHIPVRPGMIGDMQRHLSMARKLLGVDLSPETVWNLAPWSWAGDWFSNIGDVMTNVSNLGRDGMVMQYGYIMCETVRTTRSAYRVTNTDFIPWGLYGRSVERTTLSKSAVRLNATPFGFGVNMDGLSPRQIAILSAVGLSRGRD